MNRPRGMRSLVRMVRSNSVSSRKHASMSAMPVKIEHSQNDHVHETALSIKDAMSGPRYGLSTTKNSTWLIALGCS